MGDFNSTTFFICIAVGILVLLAIAQVIDMIDRHRTDKRIESTLNEIRNLQQHDSEDTDDEISILDDDDDDISWEDLMTLDMLGFFDDDDDL